MQLPIRNRALICYLTLGLKCIGNTRADLSGKYQLFKPTRCIHQLFGKSVGNTSPIKPQNMIRHLTLKFSFRLFHLLLWQPPSVNCSKTASAAHTNCFEIVCANLSKRVTNKITAYWICYLTLNLKNLSFQLSHHYTVTFVLSCKQRLFKNGFHTPILRQIISARHTISNQARSFTSQLINSFAQK